MQTKELILECAWDLFNEKGFDATSITDILTKLSIARGTLYHHFKSKEAIMDALVERTVQTATQNAEQVVFNEQLEPLDKLAHFLQVLNLQQHDPTDQLVDYLHQPQNALLHEKMNDMLLVKITPLLASILKEGTKQGVFRCAYSDMTAFVLLVSIQGVFGAETTAKNNVIGADREAAFFDYLTKILGVSYDQLAPLQPLLKS